MLDLYCGTFLLLRGKPRSIFVTLLTLHSVWRKGIGIDIDDSLRHVVDFDKFGWKLLIYHRSQEFNVFEFRAEKVGGCRKVFVAKHEVAVNVQCKKQLYIR